jgi:uncharacterized protein DUF5985
MLDWAAAVYLLCFVTSAACGGLLVRSYGRTRAPLLLWSAICFLLLALNNLLVVVDILLLPAVDLLLLRHIFALAAVGTLLYGFIWEVD